MKTIPVFSATAQYAALKPEVDAALSGVLTSGHFILGPNVSAFERELAAYVGTGEAIGLNSGTDALYLALRALGIGSGDEVITSPFTFFASSEAIVQAGARPVFVDIDAASFNLDVSRIEAAITPRTKAMLPVQLYGQPAPMQEIMSIAQRRGLRVIEDCAQAIGARVGDRRVGSFGDVGCFSFFPTKNLGAYGDGGAITTNSPALAKRVRALRAHGGPIKYLHDEPGVNSRLDELQAAVLRVKLPHLEAFTAARIRLADRYDAALGGAEGLATPARAHGCRHVFHQYTVRVRNRDEIRAALASSGIQTMVYYPWPLHLQRAHVDLRLARGAFPNAEAAALEVLSLPMYPELSDDDQDAVIAALRACVEAVRPKTEVVA